MIKKYRLLFFILILVLIDSITKSLAIGVKKTIIEGLFYFTYSENPGVIFGIFSNNKLVTIILPLILVIYLFYYFRREKTKKTLLGLAFIIAGLLGNLVDRFLYGYVIDFIYIKIFPEYSISLFNLADLFVVIGIVFVFLDQITNTQSLNQKEKD